FAAAGAGNTSITLTGTNFVSGSVVKLGGVALATYAYVNSTTMTATVPSASLVSEGLLSLTVFSPTPGGGTSSAVAFSVVGRAQPGDLRVSSEGPIIAPPLAEEAVIEPAGRPPPPGKKKNKRRKPIFREVEFINPSQNIRQRYVLTDEDL